MGLNGIIFKKLNENKKSVDITQQCFALLPQVNFPANNLNFHWRRRWWDQIQNIFLNLFYFKIKLLFTGREKHTGLWKGSHPSVFVSKYQWGWLRSFCQYCQKFQWYCVWKHLIRHTYGYDWIFHCFYVCHLFFGRLQLLTKSGKNSHISLFIQGHL